MNQEQQLMMQIWLGNLLRLMKEKQYDIVQREFEQALGIVEEDREGKSGSPTI
jgi:hypothetical protein